MKKILSAFAVLIMTAMIASPAWADATITDVTDNSGTSITRSSPGRDISVEGNNFGWIQWPKDLVVEFTEPEAFSVELEVISWSNTNIEARIPTSIASHLDSGSITGQLKITKTIFGATELFSNNISFTISPIEFRTPPMGVIGIIGGDNEITISQPPATVVHKEEDKFVFKQPPMEVTQKAEMESVTPSEAPPGSLLTIEGEYFYSQGDKVISIYFVHPTVSRSFYMDLEVISWEGNTIIARIPALDEQAFRFSSPLVVKGGVPGSIARMRRFVPYGTSEYLPPNIMEELNTYTTGLIRIITMPDTLISNTKEFRLAPGR